VSILVYDEIWLREPRLMVPFQKGRGQPRWENLYRPGQFAVTVLMPPGGNFARGGSPFATYPLCLLNRSTPAMTWRGDGVYYNGTSDIHSWRDSGNTFIDPALLSAKSELSYWWTGYLAASSFTADHPLVSTYSIAVGKGGTRLWMDDTTTTAETDTAAFLWDSGAAGNGRVNGPTGLIAPGNLVSLVGTFKGSSFGRLYCNGALVAENTSVSATTDGDDDYAASIYLGADVGAGTGAAPLTQYSNTVAYAAGIWLSALPHHVAMDLSKDPFYWW